MALPRWVKVVGVLGVVAVILFVMLPSLQAKGTGQQTDIFVGTEGGEEQVIYDEGQGFPWPATVVKLGGVTITYVRWVTTFRADSPDYTEYKVVSGAAKWELFNADTSCGFTREAFAPTTIFDVGVDYNVAMSFMGRSTDETLKATSLEIIDKAISNCNFDNGTLTLRYTISVIFRAEAAGTVPQDQVVGIYNTDITLSKGTISGSESTTRSSG